VIQSRLSHLPTNFCFLYNGHPLDPNVESTMKAADVAVSYESQYIVLIDNVHCNIGPDPSNSWIPTGASRSTSFLVLYLYPAGMLAALAAAVALVTFLGCRVMRPKESVAASYEKVPFNLDHEKDMSDTSDGLPVKVVPCLPRLRGVLGVKAASHGKALDGKSVA
jgi:hypothetical protein